MATGNNKGTVIFLAIIAVGALALSGYMFTMDLLSGKEEYGNLRLVALWDDLDKNKDHPDHNTDGDFLVEFSTQMKFDASYVHVINETRFTLPSSGLYKITLSVLWMDLTSDNAYYIEFNRNDSTIVTFDYFETDNPIVSYYKYTSSSIYINSTGGDDYYEINPNSVDGFGIYTSYAYNQLFIEYVIE